MEQKFKLNSVGRLLVGWFLIVVVWGAYRSFFVLPEFIEELIFKPIVFVFPVIFYLKKRGDSLKKSLALHFNVHVLIWGVGFGLFLACENILLWQFKEKAFFLTNFSSFALLLMAVTALGTAVSEEVLYRGFLLRNFERLLKSQYRANALVALLFVFGHVGVAVFSFGYQGTALASYLVFIWTIGYAQGFIYQRSQSLYAPIIAHALWNFSSAILMA